MIIGGKERDYLSAIITITFENVAKLAEKNKISYTTHVDLSQKEEVSGLIWRNITRINSELPEGSAVMKYVILPKGFDPDEAELTRSMKLRRGFVQN